MGRERGDRERQSEREGKDTRERWIKRERETEGEWKRR